MSEEYIDMIDLSEASDVVKVTVITGLDNVYAIPPGGNEGYVLTKYADIDNAATWEAPGNVVKITIVPKMVDNKYIASIPKDFSIIGVYNTDGQPILYDVQVTEKSTDIVTDTTFLGYVVAQKLNNIKEVIV